MGKLGPACLGPFLGLHTFIVRGRRKVFLFLRNMDYNLDHMAMGMRLKLGPEIKQKLEIGPKQRIAIKEMLRLRLALRHPELPEMKSGIEGLKMGHKILEERQKVGILVGGLSEAVWNGKRTAEELTQHKDVDIMILGKNETGIVNKFEGGIDWWLPKTEVLEVSAAQRLRYTWWENGNGVILSFGIRERFELKPGLYIPGPNWVIQMRESETLARLSHTDFPEASDYEVSEGFKNAMKKEVKSTLAPTIAEEFKGRILSDAYADTYQVFDAVEIEEFSPSSWQVISRKMTRSI